GFRCAPPRRRGVRRGRCTRDVQRRGFPPAGEPRLSTHHHPAGSTRGHCLTHDRLPLVETETVVRGPARDLRRRLPPYMSTAHSMMASALCTGSLSARVHERSVMVGLGEQPRPRSTPSLFFLIPLSDASVTCSAHCDGTCAPRAGGSLP